MKRILVLGGAGFVGRQLCRALANAPVQVTVPTRQDVSHHAALFPHVQWVHCDVTDPAALSGLLSQQDIVINLVARLHGDDHAFDELHVRFPHQLALACARAGVSHLVHVSAIGANPQGPSLYQRSKGRGELALNEVSMQTGLPITLLRPSVIFGEEDQFIRTFARLQRFAPCVPLACAHTRFQPVWVHDVAQALVQLALSAPGQARVLEACGPDVFTLAELVRHAGRWAQCARPVLPLPRPVGWLQALVMEALPGKTLMSRDNVDSMRVDNVASGHLPGIQTLGIEPSPLSSVFPLHNAT
jgi:NADH dehydrogenase